MRSGSNSSLLDSLSYAVSAFIALLMLCVAAWARRYADESPERLMTCWPVMYSGFCPWREYVEEVETGGRLFLRALLSHAPEAAWWMDDGWMGRSDGAAKGLVGSWEEMVESEVRVGGCAKGFSCGYELWRADGRLELGVRYVAEGGYCELLPGRVW